MENMSDATVRTSLDKQQAPVPAPDGRPGMPSGDPAPFADSFPADLSPSPHAAASPARTGFRMHRSRTDRMLGGVLGGLAESLDVDATLLRVGLVALTVLGAGIGVVLYAAAWILVPEADLA